MSKTNPATVLITGGGGFLGYNLARYLLSQPNAPTVISFDFQHGNDILDRVRLAEAIKQSDLVVHLAGMTNTNALNDQKEQYEAVNVTGTQNVIELAAEAGVRVIYPSTCDLYAGSDSVITEDDTLDPKPTVYAQSKFHAEAFSLKAAKAGQNVVILRLFNPYGLFQSPKKLIPNLLRNAAFDRPLMVYGNGDVALDYVFSEDVSSAIWAARNAPAGTIANVATGTGTTVSEIAELIAKTYGGFVVHIAAPDFSPRRLVGSPAVLDKLVGWKTKHNLNDGLQQTWDWFKKYQPFEPPAINHAG